MPAGEWVPPLSLGLHLTLVPSQTTWWTFLKGKSLNLQGYMGKFKVIVWVATGRRRLGGVSTLL